MRDIHITQEKIEKWKNELNELGRELKEILERRNVLQARLDALRLFEDDQEQVSIPWEAEVKINPPNLTSSSTNTNGIQPTNQLAPPDAIRSILREAERPLNKDEIRERLKLARYPMEKFRHDGGYFHTIMTRMERSGELNSDGGKYLLKK